MPASRARGGPAKIDEFGKIELRVAEVIAAEPLPKSKKLLKLTVSLGQEQRTIVAGIAEHYAPAETRGQEGRHRGESRAGEADGRRVEGNGAGWLRRRRGKLAVLTLDRDLPAGAKVSEPRASVRR